MCAFKSAITTGYKGTIRTQDVLLRDKLRHRQNKRGRFFEAHGITATVTV